jgi:hypothetical protein
MTSSLAKVWWAFWLLALLALASGSAAVSARSESDGVAEGGDAERSALLEEARALRARGAAVPWKEQVRAVDELLLPAADIRIQGKPQHQQRRRQQQQQRQDPGSPADLADGGRTAGDARHGDSQSTHGVEPEEDGELPPVPGYPSLRVGPQAHPGALRELAHALMVCAPYAGAGTYHCFDLFYVSLFFLSTLSTIRQVDLKT